jgi:glycosyltransferase involved in cell wall biosynthesis
MRIAIDLTAVRSTGTKVYSGGFMPALGRIDKEDDFLVFISSDVAPLISAQLPPNFQLQITNLNGKVGRRVLWEQVVMPRHLRAWRADVLFAAYDISPLMSPCPVLLAIRNPTSALLSMGFLSRRSVAERLKAHLHRLLSHLSCQKAQVVLYPSAYAAKLLGDLLKAPPSKRAAVHHGTDYDFWSAEQESASVLAQYNISSHRFVLFVSEFYFYKHPDVLISGFARWRSMSGQTEFKLVLVGGGRDRVFVQELHNQARELGIENAVLFVGHVPRSHVAVLYQQAGAFVLPTVMETFGFPYVEAMASGAPVICADTEFARELCGEAALYFPAGDAQALAQVLGRVLDQPNVRAHMGEAGRSRARVFSWDREAQETLALLRRAGNHMTLAC